MNEATGLIPTLQEKSEKLLRISHARLGHVGFVMDKVALEQVFSEYFGFPCQSFFHQILHHYNHQGHVQLANWWPKCRVEPVGLHPTLIEIKQKKN
jgi:hypothetical protein